MSVFLYIPNLIEYTRMVLLALFCYKMQTNHVMAATSFMGCVLLDYINGPLARVLEQTSQVGAMMDITVDSVGVAVMLCGLATFYPRCTWPLQMALAAEVSAWWLWTWSSAAIGIAYWKDANTHTTLLFVRMHFSHYIVDYIEYFVASLFYVLLYVTCHTKGKTVTIRGKTVGIWLILLWLCAPMAAFRFIVNVSVAIEALIRVAAVGNTDTLQS